MEKNGQAITLDPRICRATGNRAVSQTCSWRIAKSGRNERNSAEASYILGVVTTGSNWKFLKQLEISQYESESVLVDFDEYLISQVNKILGIFVETMKKNVIRA